MIAVILFSYNICYISLHRPDFFSDLVNMGWHLRFQL